MLVHVGLIYSDGDVSICLPSWEAIRRGPKLPDVGVGERLVPALECIDFYDFFIYWGDKHIGQIVLRDVDWHAGEAEVGYILFEPHDRGRGIGTKALTLLQKFVIEYIRLTRVMAVTSSDN